MKIESITPQASSCDKGETGINQHGHHAIAYKADSAVINRQY